MITDEYKKMLKEIHAESPFGKRRKLPRYLEMFIGQVKPKSILDFGCGKGRLIKTLQELYPNIDVLGYDPGNPDYEKSIDDVKVDLLISSDVLEHVEPQFIDETLQYLSTKSKFIYHLIALSPAKLILPDGRNAHLIQESPNWWKEKFLNLNYVIIKDEYKTGVKFSKELNREIPVEKYFIMGEKKKQDWD